MYTGRLWTMRQYAGFGTAQETNRRFRQLLAAGQMGLSTAFDLPTQMGYDSDHPMAQGEVGRVGVAIDTVDDLADLFREIPLDRVSTSMTINATAAILLAMYVVVGRGAGRAARQAHRHGAERRAQGVHRARDLHLSRRAVAPAGGRHLPLRQRRGDELQPDLDQRLPHARGRAPRRCRRSGSRSPTRSSTCGSRSTAGLAVDSFGPRLSFFFASHNDLFEEAAKFRAARRLWARLVRERFGAGDATARLRFHTQTGGVTLQAQQPLNNVVRVTVQALAAVLGGTQSLHTNGYDEALALPTERVGHAGASDPADDRLRERRRARWSIRWPGSYYVESLTDAIEAGARALIAEVDALGGAARAIELGFFQEAIARSAYELQKAQESGELVVVGVNRFTDGSPPPAIETPDFSALEAQQRARLAEVRRRRDGATRSRRARRALRAAAAGTDPLMPPILDAVRARATLGEISDTLREVWGVYRPA